MTFDPTPAAVVRLYHNPACGTSRRTLALLRERGIEPELVLYLQAPPDRDTLQALLAAMDMTPRRLLRSREALAGEMGLHEADDVTVLEAMLHHPVLIERPIAVGPGGTRLCRPAETVLEVL
jgi:arsenate reductase (glutaredoxin)